MTPLSSFRWETRGGPYRWDGPKFGEIEVYLDGIDVDRKLMDERDKYLFPIVSCLNREKSNIGYSLRYKNPAS
jgi:hypothetical protein